MKGGVTPVPIGVYSYPPDDDAQPQIKFVTLDPGAPGVRDELLAEGLRALELTTRARDYVTTKLHDLL